MSGCRICGCPTPYRTCRQCDIEERAEERAKARAEEDEDDEGEDPVPLPDGGTEIVYVRSHRGRKLTAYHTDRSCSALASAETIVERERDTLPTDLRECRHCADDVGGSNPTAAYQNALLSDGGRECGRRTCEAPSAVTYSTPRGGVRTRCAQHALADGVTGIGEARAAAILEGMTLAELVAMCEDADGVHAPPRLSRVDGLGPTTAATLAENIDRSPVADAIRDDDEEEELVTDGGWPRHDHHVATVLEGHRRPSERLRDGFRADGGVDQAVSEAELERRAKQSGVTFWAWCRRADVDPDDVLDEIRAERPSDDDDVVTDGGRRVRPDSILTHAGMGDQTPPTCPHGDVECAKPGTAPCAACLFDGGADDV